jgi:REP element-mobilizing transposase RayT
MGWRRTGRQGELNFDAGKHGGRRAGAGRPKIKGRRVSEPHKAREVFRSSEPVHVVMRALPAVGRLRRRKAYQAIRIATIVLGMHEDCRIVHASIQRNHVHLIVEAKHRLSLAAGMQAFQISAAQRINRAIGRKGQVFADRYHATVLRTPRQVRNTINYVLNNWRHHDEDRDVRWTMDPFSSAPGFAGWRERAGKPFVPPLPPAYRGLITWIPKTWLLSTGWRRHGFIGLTEVPGVRVGTDPS